jgi:sugar phosphate isomerase/epimerase
MPSDQGGNHFTNPWYCDMADHHLRRSRRDFLYGSAQSVAGLATGALLAQANVLAAEGDRFELSIHQYSLKKLFEEGQLDTFAYPQFVKDQFGFTSIEFAVEFCDALRADPKKGDAIREKSKQLGIKHRALLCGAAPALDAPTETERQAAVKDHLKWAEVAQHLGCEFIRVRASTEGDRDQQLGHATQGIGALCDALDDSPVSVLIENIAGFSRDPDWLVALVKRIGPKRVGLIADFGNFDGDIYEGMSRILPYAKSVCTKSWEFDDQGRETKIDFARMMRVIKESSFRGCIAIEYLGKEPVAGVRKTAELVNRYM